MRTQTIDGAVTPAAGLVLGSASPARRDILNAAGVEFTVYPTSLDEAAIKSQMAGRAPTDIAMALAEAKALCAVAQNDAPSIICIGADQILVQDGQLFDKPKDIAEARQTLLGLRGKTHTLISAVVLAQGTEIVWKYYDTAELEMRDFSAAFLDDYLNCVGTEVLTSVGAYRLEGMGAQLFSRVEGAHTTILGLPLLPLLAALRAEGLVKS